MKIELTAQQQRDQAVFRAFADDLIAPHADRFDQEEATPAELVRTMAGRGYLGAILPPDCGGGGMDMITYGLLNEAIGRASASVRTLITVHDMVGYALLKWGSRRQKEQWLPRLASGAIIGAFALTEPAVGSDAKGVEATATLAGDSYILRGRKRWITYGQIADLFLTFAQYDGKICAFLLERDTPGLSVRPISGMLGMRASMLAELDFEDCRVPKENMVGGTGFGMGGPASTALDLGRYTVAWGCVGLGQACLEACVRYTSERRQFGAYLKEHQLIRQMITDMMTGVRAARLLCYQAGYLKDNSDPAAVTETLIAKYFGSTMAARVASDAVQIHGALGCSSEMPVQRYYRDAKIMEIIEGSTQIQQLTIARSAYLEYGR